MADEDKQQGTWSSRVYFAPTSSPDYVRVLEDLGPLPKSGRVVATPERVTEHTHESQDQDNGAAEVSTEATVQEDEEHRAKRKEILDRYADTRKSIESETDAEYADRMERTAKALAGPDAFVSMDGAMTRQEHLAMIDRDIAKYQNGHPVYTWKDNLKGVAMAPVRFGQGIWGLIKGTGNTIVDLGKGAAAGELMQSSDPELRAEGERLAKEAADSLAERATNAGKAIIFALPHMAQQAADGNWGEPLGDTAMGYGIGKAATVLGGAVKGTRRAANAADDASGAGPADASGAGPAVGEPVSVTTGEYLETWRDFLIASTLSFDGARYMGLKLALPANYQSPLGPCQISMFDEVFSNPSRGKLCFHTADGKTIAFDRPFNFLPSTNRAFPHLDLRAPWLKELRLKDHAIIKHFRQYDDGVYRLESIEDLNGFKLTLTRTDDGRLTRADGPDGLSLTFDNDDAGRRISITLIGTDGSTQHLASYSYDASGRMTEATCEFGMSVRYRWLDERDLLHSWHNLTRTSETIFTYDESGRVVHTKTNGIWHSDRFIYGDGETRYLPGGSDDHGQLFHYDEHENVTAEIDALGGTVTHGYNRAGFRIASTDANGNTSHTRFDALGNVKERTDPEGRSTVYGWGDDGELILVIDGAGSCRRYDHDDKANVISETDGEGNVTALTRDAKGRVVETHFPNGTTERRAWDDHNRLESVTDAKGNVTRFVYDAFGRQTAVIAPNGDRTQKTYRAGAGGFDTVSAITRPDGVTVSRSFDGAGQLANVTDGEGRIWSYRYGAFSVLQAIIDPKDGELQIDTDVAGRFTSVTNALGRVYRFDRDQAGRVVAEEDFDGRVTRYRRDPKGQVIEALKPDGARLSYDYDRSGLVRRIQSFSANGERQDVTRFWYDGRAMLVRAENDAALVLIQRDRNGRIISEMLNGREVKSGRDAMGNRVLRELQGVGHGLVEYVRDPLGAIEQMIAGETEFSFKRNLFGREITRQMGDFHLLQRFDPAGQLVAQAAGPARSGNLDVSRLGWNVPGGAGEHSAKAKPGQIRRVYDYDRAFAPVSIDHSIWGKRSFAYDDNAQLTEAGSPSGTERFDYDPARNLAGASSSAEGAEGPSYYGTAFDETFGAVPPAPRPLSFQSTPGGVVQIARGPKGEKVRLIHDDCGRLIERRVDRDGFRPSRWRYRWDAHDRMVAVETPEGEEWLFHYDPFGRRISKVRRFSPAERYRAALLWPSLVGEDGIPTVARPPSEDAATLDNPPIVGISYLWDGDHMVAETPLRLDGKIVWDEAVQWHFEEGTHRPLAKQLPSGEMLAIVCDHLGTPKEMFDAKGTLVWAADHHVWGAIKATKTFGVLAAEPQHPSATTAELDCPWRFPGQYADSETGLHYNRHRHYDPLVGQYSSPDPIALSGGDRPQSYVPNPLLWSDPLGLRQIYSGHGSMELGKDGLPLTFTVPEGSTFTTYTKPGGVITDRLGNHIELNKDIPDTSVMKTYKAGEQAPLVVLHAPDGLNILGNPITVKKPTSVTDLLKNHPGDCHWAACMYNDRSPDASWVQDVTKGFYDE